MNKQELIAAMVEKSGLTKQDAEKALVAFTESVKDALQGGEKVTLIGFGTFDVREHGEREGRNPHTGESIHIAASKAPVFKPGKAFKEAFK